MITLCTSAHQELWHRVGGRRIVGTMNLRVAVQATAALPDVDRVLASVNTAGGHAGLASKRTEFGCRVRRMALLAEHGRTRLEHGRNRAAVRAMAGRAV